MKKLRQNARVSEVDDVADKIERLCKADALYQTDSYLASTTDKIAELSEALTTANKRDKAVSKLDEADTARDTAQTALGGAVSGYLYYPDEGVVSAAETVKAVLKKYTGITTESYARQSALTKSELEDLASETVATAIERLPGVAALVTRLSEAQAAFDTVNDEYNAASVASSASDTATSLKKPLLSAINDEMIPYLETMRKVNATAYEGLSALVENEIVRMNETIAARSKKSSSTDTATTE
ncbi:MAG: hypothetical protein IJS17_06890 [Clostridia bacterium]|nr:hypothetical protein [Clostridia bacterium]